MKNNRLKGSFTVEMSFLMPMILFLIMSCILAVFYFHDKNILSAAAYETAVVGSTKAREKEGIDETVLNALFRQRISGKCILFSAPDVAIHIGENEIEVTATALRKHMSVSVLEKAAITEPEQYIRDMRKAGKLID